MASMRSHGTSVIDGSEAVAAVAHSLSEVIAIYPITPASTMGELADQWSSEGRKNIFDAIPQVIEMQSEAGAAGAVHGALQMGSLTTTFTASQGLLLMIPEMYKIAGQLMPTVFHVAARTVATHALSIFGDHSDVMAVRGTGWSMLSSGSVQEAQDFAVIAHAATLKSRIPFVHFFDGFRTSHEVNKIEAVDGETLSLMIDRSAIVEHRKRGLNPDRPILRGSSQNPDVFFQSREAANGLYGAVPHIVQNEMNRFGELTGRHYHLFEYVGPSDAQAVIVLMGSGAGAVEEAIERLNLEGLRVGLLKVRLYRPFDGWLFVQSLPNTVNRIAVLDRTKEPVALGEPLYTDVIAALAEYWPTKLEALDRPIPEVLGGRYGLASKEFTPSMVAAVARNMLLSDAKRHFTVGIYDDVSQLSLNWDADWTTEPDEVARAVFYGLGSDGTVGASKNTAKIIGENTELFTQGYFVYDSKKSGSMTVSHLRFSPRPIKSTYLVNQATFVACHQFQFLQSTDVLSVAAHGATFLLNSPYSAGQVWGHLPQEVQQQIIEKRLRFYVVDAYGVARRSGMGVKINTAMQGCFFALAGFLPRDEAIAHIQAAIRKSYGKRGEAVVAQNLRAVDEAIQSLQEVTVLDEVNGSKRFTPWLDREEADFASVVIAAISEGRGDLLPVSAMPLDGSFPTGTARFEKRSIATEIPLWDAEICTACGLCAMVCPHSAIRIKAFPTLLLQNAPGGYQSQPWNDKDHSKYNLTVQVAPDDCTGCRVCADVCPVKSKELPGHKAINMEPKDKHLATERANFDYFLNLPELDRAKVKQDTIKGSQLLQPLFEFSGACAGCGETPYLKLMSQLFGDRAVIANATGCSSIFGGNLPTTPWTANSQGCGPAWCNSLFEDNGEFGLGMRLAIDHQRRHAEGLLTTLESRLDGQLVKEILLADQTDEVGISAQRQRVGELRKLIEDSSDPYARELTPILDSLIRRSVWIVGGDGWAYDIGFGGLDHVLASGQDVNILVLDTGVYSNTGGQASKATPRGATARFAASGKNTRKKDLGALAMSYGNVYVAQVAMGANPNQTLKAIREAESYHGVSLILAYSQCIAHGIDMAQGMTHQKDVVQSGMWPLYRFDPRRADGGQPAFQFDSRKPTLSFADFSRTESRFSVMTGTPTPHSEELLFDAQRDIDDRWRMYELLAGISNSKS
jgi:pyruvate-ferredoxin/flavodoxin oxidoreductase